MALLLLPQNPFISLGNQNQAKKLYAIHDPVALLCSNPKRRLCTKLYMLLSSKAEIRLCLQSSVTECLINPKVQS